MNFARSLSAAPLLCFLAACGSANASNETNESAPVAANAAAITTSAGPSSPTAFKIGTNLNSIQIWDNTRPFMNLIMGSSWQMLNTAAPSGTVDVPQDWLDANGWVKNLPAGYRVYRGMSVPAAGGNIVCKFQGSGTLNVTGGPATNVSTGAGVTSFTVPATNPKDWAGVTVMYENIDPANYIRNIDCRESSASTTETIAPEFLTAAQGFKVLRFVKWTPDVEANAASITWAKRNKPGDGEWTRNDGVPVEVMVETANKLGADPWFTLPWNADADYITRFATYVRDNLASGHQAYFEVSNEVWNGGYQVFNQARSEAQQEGLKSAEDGLSPGGPGERYSEKTKQVMSLITTVYTGQMDRVVRVFAFQHVQPIWSDLLLKYQDAYKSVDALATAPYFGYEFTADMGFDHMIGLLPQRVDDALMFANQQKAVATKYNLRYVTYEAGQHIILPNNLPLLTQIQKDPRMYDAYKRFLTGWQAQIGDTLTLFAFTGPISQFGAWGMSEYANQPLAETPKMRAVKEFLGTSTTTADSGTTTPVPTPSPTPVYYTCADGTVILATSTCPATTTVKKRGRKGGGGGTGGSRAEVGTALA